MKYSLIVLLIFVLLAQRDAQTPGSISVNIIADTSPRTQQRHHVLGHSHAMEFVQRIFADLKIEHKVAERKIWPPIYTNQCPGVKFNDNTAFNKVHAAGFTRGLILAHRQIWDEFVWTHRDYVASSNGSTGLWESPKMIVFEDDAMEIDPRAPDVAYTAVMNMTTELLYLVRCKSLHAHHIHLVFLLSHSLFIILHSSFIIHHSSFIIHHSSLITHHSSLINSLITHHSSTITLHPSLALLTPSRATATTATPATCLPNAPTRTPSPSTAPANCSGTWTGAPERTEGRWTPK